MYSQIESVKKRIEVCLNIIRMYDFLLDLYVLDFFVDNHWAKIPKTWRDCFLSLDVQKLGDIILGKPANLVLPLSLLALTNVVQALSLPRKELKVDKTEKQDLKSNNEHGKIYQTNDINVENYGANTKCYINLQEDTCADHHRLKNLFLKHVKLKKRHEISLMAEVVHETAVKSDCKAVIDFGSGLGHLVRVLAYKHNLHTVGIECQNQLTEEARKLDKELATTASKHLSKQAMSRLIHPIHYNLTLVSNNQLDLLPLPNEMSQYGLVGLHPCGNLGPLLLKHFVNSNKVKFICVVGCCYMKLTEEGYPMSKFVKGLDSQLSYISREMACHAIEVYCERLKMVNYENLKVHAYRAALERILVEQDPKLKHVQIRNVKHSDTMNFQKYCQLAVDKLNIPLPSDAVTWSRGEADLRQWKRVVTLYSLRLALAPLVETVLLLDRVLYVLEHGLSCEIHPVFDPKISARNHIIIARRL